MSTEKQTNRNFFRDVVVGIVMLICIIYIVNPTAGVIELIPDNFPFIGNLDEGIATTLLLSGFSYFGYNITNIFKRK